MEQNNQIISKQEKKKLTTLSIIGIAIFIIGIIGITYAFFNYTRTGTANVIKTGKIAFNTEQGNAINLTNMFPIDVSEGIPDDNTKVGSVTIHVTGDTTYTEGIEYLVSIVNVQNTVGTKKLPISIDVSYTANGTGKTIGVEDNDYFTNRGTSAATSIYHVYAKDNIESDGDLIVGYIKAGETGIDGNIVIKAFLDNELVAISDTYNGDETDNMGTTTEWVADRTVFTTTEWNALQSSGVSFQIKIEANEGIWVEEPPTAYSEIIKNVNTNTLIDFGQNASDSNGKGLYILPRSENDANPIYYYRGAVTDNNVIFGGFCWQIIRTTETGGIKMIYNGVATDNGTTCTNSTASTRHLANYSRFNSEYSSMADVGYMNNMRYPYSHGVTSGAIYGKDIEWDGTNYLVIEETANTASTNTTKDNDHHYSCGASGTTTCSTVRYYYYNNYYITLSSGDLLADAIYKMTGNGNQATKTKNVGYNLNANDSTIKTAIDNWFRNNLTSEVNLTNSDYSIYLEDTVYCNDRSFKTLAGNTSVPTYEESGWNPNGGVLTNTIYFGTNNRWYNNGWYSTTNVPSMTCPNESDRFTVSNTKGNGALTYPVGLLTADEVIMAGISGNNYADNHSSYLYTGESYWTMSPYYFAYNDAFGFDVHSYGYLETQNVNYFKGVRPVISLKSKTEFERGGEGTAAKPYVVKYN